MPRRIAHVTLVVGDYDEAIAWYRRALGFEVREDTPLPDAGKRWVTIGPEGGAGPTLVLGRATGPAQVAAIGHQTGGRVFLFLETDDINGDLVRLRDMGVRIVREPMRADYGTVAVFADLYGNLWDLIERPR